MKCVEIDYDESKGYPTGEGLYYECKRCGSRVSTVNIREAGFCKCRNLHIDVDYCRVSIKSPGSVRLLDISDRKKQI